MPRMEWHAPLDPSCPVVEKFMTGLYDDPMTDAVPGDVVGDIVEDFERRHRAHCSRCQEYGCANIEVR